eukprot:7368151-Lingulodinium_polyedra.AAC.1
MKLRGRIKQELYNLRSSKRTYLTKAELLKIEADMNGPRAEAPSQPGEVEAAAKDRGQSTA